ncbi:hypothetical protein LCGC14_1303770 [marine sediment metagenome]|uniref:Uncharacterized protein n=1 Tax=marine sediment metagenome TaxID=412755 RepID=A0A0F9NRU1_9ZZZZ
MPRPHVFISIALLALAIALLSLPLFGHEGHGKGDVAPFDLDTPRKVSPETAAHIGLQTAEIDFGGVEDIIRLTGIVRPVPEQVHSVASRVDGTVLSIAVQVGDVVQKGDLLVEIESPQLARSIYELRTLETESFSLHSTLARARSRIDELAVELNTAQQHASIAQAEYDRLENSEGAVAVNVLSKKQAEAVEAQGRARLTEIELSLAREQLELVTRQAQSMDRSREALEQVIATMKNTYRNRGKVGAASADTASSVASSREDEQPDRASLARFHSPISGVVIARDVMSGQGVDAGESLLTIAQYSRVQVEGELPESLVHRAGDLKGKQVRIRRVTEPGADPIATGTVRFVVPVIDPIKRTTHVIIEADNPVGSLRDGLYVDLVVVLRAETSTVVVPASAVVIDGPMHFVFVKDGEFFKKQDINPGARDDKVIEVKKGLLPGDVVVVQGAYSLTQLRPTAVIASSEEDSGK